MLRKRLKERAKEGRAVRFLWIHSLVLQTGLKLPRTAVRGPEFKVLGEMYYLGTVKATGDRKIGSHSQFSTEM